MAGSETLPDWARHLGPPEVSGLIRSRLEDFRVEEIPLIEPDGEGSHLWLEIEKRGANTNWIAGQLARAAGVKQRDVGFAGMKDRHGVTSQWFSVGLQEAGNDDWDSWAIEDATVLQAHRHGRKLRRGTLAGNRFRIVVRNLEGDTDGLADRIERIANEGVPNYFGPQRFGRGGQNVQKAREWLIGGGRIRRDRRSIYLSAARSYLFNQVLSSRVNAGDWNRLLDGDIAILDGRRPVFACTLPDAELERRCNELEIHPTGPLPGKGRDNPEREAAEREQAALEDEWELVAALARAGAESARRSLRLRPRDLEHELQGDKLTLSFELPPGSYATSLLRELATTEDATISRL